MSRRLYTHRGSTDLFLGTVLALMAFLLCGILGEVPVFLPALILGWLGFRRPVMHQAFLLLPVVFVIAVLRGETVLAVLAPVLVALIVCNLAVRTENANRWGMEHGFFCAAALFIMVCVSLIMDGFGGILGPAMLTGAIAVIPFLLRLLKALIGRRIGETSPRVYTTGLGS